MSRPPRFLTKYPTTKNPLPGCDVLDFLPSEFADFVDLQRQLASEELGFPPTAEEGDFAGTLMELSALVAHVLGVYQDTYANEAFLGTAQSGTSLVRHGRRLGYEPSPGMSATGHVVFTVRPGQRGTIPKGFALTSVAVGEKKSEEYETLADAPVDAEHDNLLPDDALTDIPLSGASTFQVEGIGFGIEVGESVVVQRGTGDFLTSISVSAHEVTAVTEDEASARTTLTVSPVLPTGSFANAVLLAKPKTVTHLFGWDTSPEIFTSSVLEGGTYPGDPNPGETKAGYVVSPSHAATDIYLAEELKNDLSRTAIVRLEAGTPTAFKIKSHVSKSVTLKHVQRVQIKDADNNTLLDTKPTVAVSRTVSTLELLTTTNATVSRSSQPIRTSQWLLDWRVSAPIVTKQPNPASVTLPLVLEREVAGLSPGQLIALCTYEGAAEEVCEIARLVTVDKGPGGKTQIGWELVDPPSGGRAWTLGELRVRGNVAEISHGKSVSELLGDSDGVTPFLRFGLKNKPLTYLPGPKGAEAALEVRVNGVLWTQVADFEGSSPNDRHYLVQRDEDGNTFVVFGGAGKGAIPGAGKRHITASYRVGVGLAGNAEPRTVSRIKKAHPLLEKATNLRAITGGADPAALEDIRTQAPSFVKTFDRAVSVEDHKNLVLLFPGIVKANAEWAPLSADADGIRVVAADSEGNLPSPEDVKAFLQARRDDSVPLEVVGPTAVGVRVRIALEIDPAFERVAVEQEVRNVLTQTDSDAPGLFTFLGRELGQPAFLSELYERVTRVAGVRFAEVLQFDTLAAIAGGAPDRVLDTLVARADEWFELLPEDLSFIPVIAGQVMP